ncbi:MAG TPA: prealbumin-like fold domain-containing protein [Thermomicrobiales bacterium]|nr:prealbumin-like fold domain-containing protein [Thermomicrobiales bacterium]
MTATPGVSGPPPATPTAFPTTELPTVFATPTNAVLTPPSATPTLVLPLYGAVIVTYADVTGQGVPGSWFQLNASDCEAPFRPARVTNSSGSVRFDGIPLGSYCVAQVRSPDGYAPAPQRPIVVDREQVPVIIGATWLGSSPAPMPTQEPIPDTTGGAPELEIRVWRCMELGSGAPLFHVFGPGATGPDDGTSSIPALATGCAPAAADLLIYPSGETDGSAGDAMPVHIGADGLIVLKGRLAPTAGRPPHLLSDPASGALAAFDLMPASRTRIAIQLGGIPSGLDSASPLVLTLPAAGSGWHTHIREFAPGALLLVFMAGIVLRARRRILGSRL